MDIFNAPQFTERVFSMAAIILRMKDAYQRDYGDFDFIMHINLLRNFYAPSDFSRVKQGLKNIKKSQ